MSFAAQVLSHRSYRKRHVIGLSVLFALLLWGAIWGFAAYRFNALIDEWVATSKNNGYPLSFSSRSTDGTLLTIHIHLDQFKVNHAGGHGLEADEAVLYANVWDWTKVSTKLRRNIKGRVNGTPFSAEVLKFGFDKPDFPPLTYMETGLTVWAQMMGLTLNAEEPFALGNKIDNLSFELRVMGTPPDFSNEEAIKAWNDASGVVEFDQFDMAWGPLGLSAKGTVGLNASLQPEGAFSGKVDGLDDAIDTLVAKGIIEKRQQNLLKSSLSVLARPSSAVGSSAPIIPISIQMGGLYLGPVKLLSLPPVIWSKAP